MFHFLKERKCEERVKNEGESKRVNE